MAYVPSRIAEQPEPAPDAAVLQVPAKLDPRIHDLATKVLKDTKTDRERMRAVRAVLSSEPISIRSDWSLPRIKIRSFTSCSNVLMHIANTLRPEPPCCCGWEECPHAM